MTDHSRYEQGELAGMENLHRLSLDGVDQAIAAEVENLASEIVSMQWIATVAFVFIALDGGCGHRMWMAGQAALAMGVLSALVGIGCLRVAIRANNWLRTMAIGGQRMLLGMGKIPTDIPADPLLAALEGRLISQNSELPTMARDQHTKAQRYSRCGLYASRAEFAAVGIGVVLLLYARFVGCP